MLNFQSHLVFTLTVISCSLILSNDGHSVSARSDDNPRIFPSPLVGNSMPLNSVHPALGYAIPEEPGGSRDISNFDEANGYDDMDGSDTDDINFTRDYGSPGIDSIIRQFESVFRERFERRLDELPKSQRFERSPWPGSYYPVAWDGINYPSNGYGPSAVTKYAKAYNLDPKILEDRISAVAGIDAHPERPTCRYDLDCENLNDGSVCSARQGRMEGRCIPPWWGICHAWAPAAILEPEPKCPVAMNNVKFGVDDIKALVTQMYDKSAIGTIFAGNRCNSYRPQRDWMGRFKEFRCRDMTPDVFHLILTNVVGRFNFTFVADVDAKAPVWNQPVLGYQVVKSVPVTSAQAYKLITVDDVADPNFWSFNPQAKILVHVETRFVYVVESSGFNYPLTGPDVYDQFLTSKTYEYILELDNRQQIIGGEWAGLSKEDHLDFLWMPTTYPNADFQIAGITYKNVKDLLRKSVNCLQSNALL